MYADCPERQPPRAFTGSPICHAWRGRTIIPAEPLARTAGPLPPPGCPTDRDTERAMTQPIDLPIEDAPKVPTSPRLRVLEARLEDVESGTVRVSAGLMQRMSLLPGDVVMIQGERPC